MNINWSNVKDLTLDGKSVKKLELDGQVVWEKKKVVYYEYCVNTASTRIDTGIAANNNTRLEFKLWSNNTDSFYSIGTRTGSSGSQLFSLTGSRNDQSVIFGIGYVSTRAQNLTRTANGFTYSGWYQTNGDMTFSWYLKDEGTNTEYNGSNISYTQSLANNNLHIFLFSNGFNDIIPTLRLYYVRIYQDGVLVRDFRPAKVNGVDGLYDEVSGQLYSTSNVAVGGNEIKYYDYLQNDGVAYIDTEIYGSGDISTEFKFRNLGSANRFICGGTGNYTPVIVQSNNWFNTRYTNVGDSIVTTIVLIQVDQNDHTIRFNFNNSILWDGVEYASNLSIKNDTKTLYLFSSSGTQYTATARIYYCRIYDNGTLVRDYKPCLYNGEAGLWDLVEGKFYGNANNTGTLTVGNDE